MKFLSMTKPFSRLDRFAEQRVDGTRRQSSTFGVAPQSEHLHRHAASTLNDPPPASSDLAERLDRRLPCRSSG